MEINKVQELQFELMKEASFNSFDGTFVVNSLKEHRDLWRGCILDRDDLIKLRDIEDGYWNVDTLSILPVKGKEDELRELANEWGADEISWTGGSDAAGELGASMLNGKKEILTVWWD